MGLPSDKAESDLRHPIPMENLVERVWDDWGIGEEETKEALISGNWQKIVGKSLSGKCAPINLSKDGKILNNMTIIITGKKIKSVKKGFEFPKNDNDIVIDLKDSTVMPGFIDLHVHIESEYNPEKYLNEFTAEESEIAFSSLKFAKRTLMAGFTTVRDLG